MRPHPLAPDPTGYRFAALTAAGGVVHAISIRAGGVSDPPFASLNLGDGVGDDPQRVAHNRARWFGALGVAPGRLVTARQVHGTRAHIAVDADVARTGVGADATRAAAGAADGVPAVAGGAAHADWLHHRPAGAADALCTAVPGVCVAVFVADCVPVVLFDPRAPAVAVVHAGWRGTVGGVARRALAAMAAAFGTRPGDVLAGIGPSIGPDDFEVGPEVAQAFAAAFPDDVAAVVRSGPGDRAFVDLWAANAVQLARAGVPGDRIEVAGISTPRALGRFYSHRAEGGRTGRFVLAAMLPSEDRPAV